MAHMLMSFLVRNAQSPVNKLRQHYNCVMLKNILISSFRIKITLFSVGVMMGNLYICNKEDFVLRIGDRHA